MKIVSNVSELPVPLRGLSPGDLGAIFRALEVDVPRGFQDGGQPPPRSERSPQDRSLVYKVLTVSKTRMVDRKTMEIEQVISGENKPDSYGDIVRADGWDFERWLKNPVVLWAHSYWSLPIATGLDIRVEDKEVVSKARFWNGDGAWGDFAREVFEQYASDPPYMRGWSVGFMPTKAEPMYAEDSESGRPVFLGYDYLEKELWEYSSVPVPAYADALSRAVQSGRFPQTAERLREIVTGSPRADTPDDARGLQELTGECVRWWTKAHRRRTASERRNL